MSQIMLDWAAYYASHGLALHWLAPRSKAITAPGWTTAPVPTLPDLRNAYQGDNNLGVRTGHWSQPEIGHALVVLDFDVQDKEITPAELQQARDAVQDLLGDPDQYPTVISGSGGASRHYWAKVPVEYLPVNATLLAAERRAIKPGRNYPTPVWELALMADGKQVVVPPSIHPDSGNLYEWGRLPDMGIPTLPATAMQKLTTAPSVPQDVTPEMPPLLPDSQLPPIAELRVPEQAKQYLLGEIGPYTPKASDSDALLSVASQMFLGGHTASEVLSILFAHKHYVAVRHASVRRAAIWLWDYTVSKAAKLAPVQPDPEELLSEYQMVAGVSEDTAPAVSASLDDLLIQCLRLSPISAEDGDRAVAIYWLAKRRFGETNAERVLAALKNQGFKPASVKADAKKRARDAARNLHPENGPNAVALDYTDPRHPVNQPTSTRMEASAEYLTGRFIYIPTAKTQAGAWYDRASQRIVGPAAIDSMCRRILTQLVERGVVEDGVPVTQFLLQHPNTVYVFDQTYWPGQDSTVVDIELPNRGVYQAVNTWTPDGLPLTAGNAGLWLEHMENLFPNTAERNHVLDYMACVLQKPGVKINHAIVVMSTIQGVGKDTMLKPLHFALKTGAADVNYETVMSPYQSWMAKRKLVVIQETKDGSKIDLKEMDNFLKDKIASTGSGVSILNLKYGEQDYTQPNLTAFFIFSNHPVAVAPGDSSRRYSAHMIPDTYIPDHDKLRELNEWLDDGGNLEVVSYLKRRNISHFQPSSPPPQTGYLRTLQAVSVGPVEAAIKDAIRNLQRRKVKWFTAREMFQLLSRDSDVDPRAVNTAAKVNDILMRSGFPLLRDAEGHPVQLFVPEAFYDPMWSPPSKPDFRDTKARLVFTAVKKPPTGVTEFAVLNDLCPAAMRKYFQEWYVSGGYHDMEMEGL